MPHSDESSYHILALMSGGVDSTAMVLEPALTAGLTVRVHGLFVDYGQQSASLEWKAAQSVAAELGIDLDRVYLSKWWMGDMNVPPGAVDPSGPRIVPARNAMLLSTAAAFILSDDTSPINTIWIGATENDASNYPDCRGEFLEAMSSAFFHAYGIEVFPGGDGFWESTRAQRRANTVGLETWSCYAPLSTGLPCEECDSCRQD